MNSVRALLASLGSAARCQRMRGGKVSTHWRIGTQGSTRSTR